MTAGGEEGGSEEMQDDGGGGQNPEGAEEKKQRDLEKHKYEAAIIKIGGLQQKVAELQNVVRSYQKEGKTVTTVKSIRASRAALQLVDLPAPEPNATHRGCWKCSQQRARRPRPRKKWSRRSNDAAKSALSSRRLSNRHANRSKQNWPRLNVRALSCRYAQSCMSKTKAEADRTCYPRPQHDATLKMC
jgi:hypothetical protein